MLEKRIGYQVSSHPCGSLKNMILLHDVSLLFVGFQIRVKSGEEVRFRSDGSIDVEYLISEGAIEFRSTEDLSL